MLRVLVVALVLLVAAMTLIPRNRVPPPEEATEYSEPLNLPAFALTTQHGDRFDNDDLVGRFTLLFFGFTYCPDICPLSLRVLADARAAILSEQPAVAPDVVLISVDPARDTPARLADYLMSFDADFIGATSSDGGLDPLLERFGVTVMRQALPGGNYTVTHNPQVFVIGPQAQLIAIISQAEEAEAVRRDYLRIRSRYLNGSLGQRPRS